MPSSYAFKASYKALLINNLTSPHFVGSNCEEDGDSNFQSQFFFLTKGVTIVEPVEELSVEDQHLLITLVERKMRSSSILQWLACPIFKKK